MRTLAVLAALIGLALAPATAAAGAYTDVLRVYQAQGSVPPCGFSSSELTAALKGIDTYGQQYFADFTEAVQTALAQRASGACAGRHAAQPAIGATAVPRTALPASLTSATDAGVPAPIIVMGAIALALALAVATGLLISAFGRDPGWAAAWRHAWGEASFRAGGGIEDFADWWRSGR